MKRLGRTRPDRQDIPPLGDVRDVRSVRPFGPIRVSDGAERDRRRARELRRLRQQRSRQRRRTGKRLVKVEVGDDFGMALIDSGRVSPDVELSDRQLGEEAGKIVADFTARWTAERRDKQGR